MSQATYTRLAVAPPTPDTGRTTTYILTDGKLYQKNDSGVVVEIGTFAGAAAGGSLSGTYPNPGIAAGAVGGTEIAAAIKDPAAGTAGLRTLGTGAAQAAAGNDSRLSDSRAPTGSAGGDLTGTYPNPTVAALAITDAKVAAANKDGAAGTASMRTLGTGAAQAAAGNDSRLSDDRRPVMSSTLVAAITSDQNDYSSIGASTSTAYLTPNADPRNITGITNGAEGRIIRVINSSSANSLVFAHESASSTAANRFSFPNSQDYNLGPGRVVLIIYNGGTSRWNVLELPGPADRVFLPAVATDDPNNSNWAVNAIASLQADGTNAGLTHAAFDDTTEQGRGFELWLPPGTTKMNLIIIARAQTAPGATRTVGPKVYKRLIAASGGGSAVSSWDSVTPADLSFPTNTNWQVYSRTILYSAFTSAMVAGNAYQFEFTRVNPGAGTELVGNMNLKMIIVEFI